MALVEQAKAENDRVVTTIFLNPTQFGDAALALENFLEEDFNECIKWGHLSYQRQSGLQLTMIAGHEARGICRQLCATMNCSTQSPRDFSKRWLTAAFDAAGWKSTRRHCGADCEGSQKRLLQPEKKRPPLRRPVQSGRKMRRRLASTWKQSQVNRADLWQTRGLNWIVNVAGTPASVAVK